MNKKELIEYWVASSDQDYQAMIHLIEKCDYTWALFIGHLVVEKLIKAWYVRSVSDTPPFIHDLVRLAEKACLDLEEEQKDVLDTISTFNIQARYDDYKMEFHKKCSHEFAHAWTAKITEFRKWIKKRLMKS